MIKLNCMSLILKCWICTGSSSISLVENKGIKGLWWVCTLNFIPIRKSAQCSIAQVDRQGLLFYLGITALSLCHRSAGVYHGLKLPGSCYCKRTAASLKLLASAETVDSFCGLYSARTCSDAMSSYSLLNASCWIGPQTHAFSLLSRSHEGVVFSAKFGQNFIRWLTNPKEAYQVSNVLEFWHVHNGLDLWWIFFLHLDCQESGPNIATHSGRIHTLKVKGMSPLHQPVKDLLELQIMFGLVFSHDQNIIHMALDPFYFRKFFIHSPLKMIQGQWYAEGQML